MQTHTLSTCFITPQTPDSFSGEKTSGVDCKMCFFVAAEGATDSGQLSLWSRLE